jgi:hypothetical protein
MKSLLFSILFIASVFFQVKAQGIRGYVESNTGERLPYASIYISELKKGSSSNVNGDFEIALPSGTYTLMVQYIGYVTLSKSITIGNNWQNLNLFLQEQSLLLDEIVVKSGKEDPAYTIMRKAIAKSKYHLLQYDSYEVDVYIKGTGKIDNVPFFLRNTMKNEGINVDEAYTTESVSHIKFTQPNTINETVLSVRTKGEGMDGVSPNTYIVTSFYNEKIAESISPLSKAAFVYYRFEYEGSFIENGYTINKIKVIPRSRGEQVFEGSIFIIEDLWAIHSLELITYYLGFEIDIRQNYAAIEQDVWMPITHKFIFSGKVLGFKGSYEYLASMNDYKVELNKDLQALSATLIDEKIEDIPKELRQSRPSLLGQELGEDSEKITRKQLNRMMNEYEKEQKNNREEPDVVSITNKTIDSLATKRDSDYWSKIRPVPLTESEILGYQRDDSLADIRMQERMGKDTTRRNGQARKVRFKPQDVLLGNSYRLNRRGVLVVDNTLIQTAFNTVEGFNTNFSARYEHKFDSARRTLKIGTNHRYGFSGNDYYWKGNIDYTARVRRLKPRVSMSLEGGIFVDQFNTVEMPIHPAINTTASLLYRQNFMKLFEKSYGRYTLNWQAPIKWKISGYVEYAQRSELFNTSDYSFYNKGERVYTPNFPENIELIEPGFPTHQALLFETKISYKPIVKYRIVNGRRYSSQDSSPEYTFLYRKGIDGVAGSDVDFDHIELGFNHRYEFGISGKLQFELKAGTFLNRKKTYFMDFKHFDGNRTVLSSLRPAGAFRLLDYYIYSTDREYFSGHTHYQFRKFLLTQLPEIRFSGLRENLFFNYLKTEASPNYMEVGYSLDNIFRLFRVEVAAGFNDGKYQETGLRIGVASIINISR